MAASRRIPRSVPGGNVLCPRVRDCHAFPVSLPAQVYVAALLPLDFKARAFGRANDFAAFDARESFAHAATGTDRRAMKNGSGSVGTTSPSSRRLSM
jgi:hypothetical protein